MNRTHRALWIAFLEAASCQLFGTGIGLRNDDRRFNHADMLRYYDAAIEASKRPRRRRGSAACRSDG